VSPIIWSLKSRSKFSVLDVRQGDNSLIGCDMAWKNVYKRELHHPTRWFYDVELSQTHILRICENIHNLNLGSVNIAFTLRSTVFHFTIVAVIFTIVASIEGNHNHCWDTLRIAKAHSPPCCVNHGTYSFFLTWTPQSNTRFLLIYYQQDSFNC
jgi:hypothetical protein